MSVGPFLTLDAVLLPPPGPAVVALALATGLFALGRRAARLLLNVEQPDGLQQAGGFILVTALLAAFVHLLALLGWASVSNLRVLGAAVVLSTGFLLSHQERASLLALASSARNTVTGVGAWRQLAYGLCAVTVLALLLASLGPPTDIDSLAYHLSLPLNWLAHQGAHATPYWLHSRLVGIGESINMLGLAMGTDCLGSLVQGCGLLVAIAAVRSAANTPDDRLFALLLVVACPLWSYMVLTSKPLLLPVAASTVALALLWRQLDAGTSTVHWRELLLLFFCAAFAVACKYSFGPGAAILGTVIAYRAWRASGGRALITVFASAGIAVTALVLPVWLRNAWFYGDPVSPTLEFLAQVPEPAVIAFSWYLRNFAGDHSLENLLRLPWDLVVPTGPGHFTTVLGAGALAALVALDRNRHRQLVLLLAAAIAFVAAMVGQLQARFFIEPYLWCALAAVCTSWTLRKRILRTVLVAQLVAGTAVALFAAYALAPAAISTAAKERALHRHAADYMVSRWLNEVLPEDAIVATDRRSILYAQRPTLPHDYAQLTWLSRIPKAEKRQRILLQLRAQGVNTLVLSEPKALDIYGWLVAEAGEAIATAGPFEDAVRNPWRKGRSFRVNVFDLRDHPFLTEENKESRSR